MRDNVVELSGVVLLAQPVGEYDKRLVILTRERGKITAFAHGVRRPKNRLMAASNPFVFAVFTLSEGRNAYSLLGAEVAEYFTELSAKIPGVFYGYYFLELADYYGREGLEAPQEVNLIFVTLRAILKEQMPLPLIRAVYELRLLTVNGEYAPPKIRGNLSETVFTALHYVARRNVGELYAFGLSGEAELEFEREVREQLRHAVDKSFKSLAVIEKIE